MAIGYDGGICIANMLQGYGMWVCHRDMRCEYATGIWHVDMTQGCGGMGRAGMVCATRVRVRGRAGARAGGRAHAHARFYLGDERSV